MFVLLIWFSQLLNTLVACRNWYLLIQVSTLAHLWMRFLYRAIDYSLVLNGEGGERKETPCDNSWFSGCEFTPVPPGSTRHLEHRLPPKFTHPHPLSCLGAGGFSPYYPHYRTLSQLRHILLALNLGETEAPWSKVICSRIPLSSDAAKIKRNLQTPAWV